MSPNPFEPPRAPAPTNDSPARTYFVLASVGGFLAAGYWALLTALLGLGIAAGTISSTQIVLPAILIVLYIMRGAQILKGDVAATQRILWLHIVGGVVALLQMGSAGSILAVLQTIKIGIHVFGGITAFLARRVYLQAQTQRF
jgi:hypothetical protein